MYGCSTILVDLPPGSNRFRLAAWVLLALLVALRIPSLAQPPGADQALYAYVGQRILHGEVPYRDAWDQKPPAIHVSYAAMLALWPHTSVVAAADLLIAILTAWLLGLTARRMSGQDAIGLFTAALYLLLANPAYTRLGGVRIRAQCETFIGLLVAAALAILAKRLCQQPSAISRRDALLAGLCIGLACVFKYNAAVYALPVAIALAVAVWREPRRDRPSIHRVVAIAGWASIGAALPLLVMIAAFASAGALHDLYLATITYNLQYSGQTYEGIGDLVRYLVTFPVGHARLDSLWMLGGAATAVLLVAARRRPELAVPAAWVIAACVAIAINGRRGLPQYFVQAWPPLALAAGLAGGLAWRRLPVWGRLALLVAVVAAVPRVTQFDKMIATTVVDARRLLGAIDEQTYLGRFGRADSADKYSALAVHALAGVLETDAAPTDTVFVFGFSPGAYVESERRSASRFFWSRPVIIGFEAGRPGYGVDGLLEDLQREAPRLVALQARDWDPDGPNSLDFFLAEPRLHSWLTGHYVPSGSLYNFQLWTRSPGR
jgi:hypothetical protein